VAGLFLRPGLDAERVEVSVIKIIIISASSAAICFLHIEVRKEFIIMVF